MKHLLWDHDGVLVDTEQWYFRATQAVLQRVGVDVDEQIWVRNMASGKSLWPDGADHDQLRAERNRIYQQYLRTEEIEIAGVDRVLALLGERHLMAIVTTARRADFELIHRDRDIVRHMEFVLTVEDYPRAKPAPDPYLAALERFAIEPSAAVVVEDSARGLNAAVAAGINCIVVKNAFTASHDFSPATAVVESIEALPDALFALL